MSNYDNDEDSWTRGFDYEPEDEELEDEPARNEPEGFDFGEVALFDSKALETYLLDAKGIYPSQWRWAIYEAEKKLRHSEASQLIEHDLVRELVLLGRPYAIARYTKWESVDFPSALTASLPLGLKALLSQYLSGQGLNRKQQFNTAVRDALISAAAMTGATAYSRTSTVQALIHQIARETSDQGGPGSLDREATRKMLSLARLHFSVAEIDFGSFTEMGRLSGVYTRERESQTRAVSEHQVGAGGNIRNWRLRHLRPLTDLFPFAIRHGLERGIRHMEANGEVSRDIALNELALAHCGLILMRMNARARTRK